MKQRLSDLLKQPFFFCAVLVLSALPLPAADVFGLALQVEGEVLVTRGILEFEAAVEEVLMWDDEIETGEDGTIQLTFDSSFLSIGPNTLVSFEKELNDEGEELFIMTLEQGSFRSKILNMGSRQFFEVHTDGGKLRVHGTDFVTSFDGEADAGFNVAVIQGSVGMSPLDSDDGGSGADSGGGATEPVMLTQNQSGGLDSGGGAGDVSDMSFADAASLKSELPIPGDGQGADVIIDDFEVPNPQDFVPVVTGVEDVIEATKEIKTIQLTIKGGIDPGV